MSAEHTNRGDINLPVAVSNEILQKIQQSSTVMKLARKVDLPGQGMAIPVILGDPEPAWVGETEKKAVSDPTLDTKIMQAYTLAVIVPFSNQFKRDRASLFNEIVKRIPGAFGQKIDKTVFFGAAPGDNFDTLAGITGYSIASDAYSGIVAADGDVADHDGITNGIILAPKGKSALLAAVDDNNRPLFINNIAEDGIPQILGAKTYESKAAYKSGSPSTVGILGDWNQAMYGLVQSLTLDFSKEATLDLGGGKTINLFQQNMFAVRAEIEFGFRADTNCFAALTSNLVSG